MTLFSVRALALACALGGAVAPAYAQEVDDPADLARFRFGALRFTPTLEITSLGRDSNVFNEFDDAKSDTTGAFGPSTRFWLLAGPARVSGKVGAQYLYFHTYATQRAWNTNDELEFELPLARITPFVAGTYVNSRERQGYEIDSRARRRDISGSAGTSLRISGKTDLVFSFRRLEAKYDEKETFLGSTLAEALNRREDTTAFQFRQRLTPLTTLVVNSEIGRDRFLDSDVRNSNSVKVMPGFELKPFALISGSAFVGYRRFDALSEDVPDYEGVVAAVNARYTMTSTRFDVKVDRDLAYSYQVTQPYYALLDVGLTITQRITFGWELVGQTSWQRLAYKHTVAPVLERDRVDRGREYGAGVGYRLGDTARLGVDVRYATRRSDDLGVRNYEGFRVFSSITYGLQQ